MSHHEHTASCGNSHGTMKSYIVGFMLSLALTIIPFMMVWHHMVADQALYATIAAFAIAQLFVQVVFFLHLNTSSEARWNLICFIFTVVVVAILVVGTLWIMYNLNYYMVA